MRIVVMTRAWRLVPLAGVVAGLLAAGCAASPEQGSGAGDEAGALEVAASFYPLQYVTEAVGADRVAVTNLTTPGAEPHDLELAPREVGRLGDADLVVYLEGFQPAVDDAVSTQAAETLDVTAAADLRGDDPHFWLDPLRLADVADAVAERLGELDGPGAETYEANAARLREELTALDAELADGLAACDVDVLVTGHEAFGYLADRYGFMQVGISGLDPDAEPDPGAIAEVADLVRDRGVTTVYSEVLVDPAVAQTVAAEAGAQTAVLDPVEGITDASAGEDYPAVMRANLETLREGQQCR